MPRAARVLIVVWGLAVVGLSAVVAMQHLRPAEEPSALPGVNKSIASNASILHSYVIVVESSLDTEELATAPPAEHKSAEFTQPCDPEIVGESEGEVVSIYHVVEGQLADHCYGRQDDVVVASWAVLAEFATPQDLKAIRLFAGIESDTVAAFVGPFGQMSLDEFVIAVDVASAAADRDQLRLTMAHELSHVLTLNPAQFDASISPPSCETHHNGWVCYEPDSHLNSWIQEFWTDDELESLPRSGAIDEEGGIDRCTLDRSFLGSYAASHPEEDFAESFSAFVFGVEVSAAVAPRIEFFGRYPEFVALRDRAASAGHVNLPNFFGRCG